MGNKNAKLRWTSGALAAFVAGLIFLFLPSEIYLRNPVEFVSTPMQLVRDLMTAWFWVTLILTLPSLVPVPAWQTAWRVALGAFAYTLWISGVFLVPDFGSMDGAGFNLDRHHKTLFSALRYFRNSIRGRNHRYV